MPETLPQQARPGPLDAARLYLARGWIPVPIPHGEKGPKLPGWPELRPTAADLSTLFPGRSNLGILLGEPSGWLVDVDLDCPEALELAPKILPPTPAIFGRPGKPASHWLYIARGAASWRADDPGGPELARATLCELRSTGGQTVFPPSVHPSGELVAWESIGWPAEVDAAELRRAVGVLASCSLMRRRGVARPGELEGEDARRVRSWTGLEEPPAPAPPSAPLPAPAEGMGWIDQVKARGVAEVARALGLEVEEGGRRGQIRPCPACGKAKRSSGERGRGRAPAQVTSDGGGWECNGGCGAKGSALDLLAWHVAGRADLRGREWAPVREEAERLGLCSTDAPRAPRASARGHRAPRPMTYPPRAEVIALWRACRPVTEDPAVVAYLERRGWTAAEVATVARLDLARALPLGIDLPAWWPWRGGPWRLVVPAVDGRGILRSLHARAIVPDASPAKRWPWGFDAGGLLLANGAGRDLLRGEKLEGIERVRVLEGLTDTLRAAARAGERVAVFGVGKGAASALEALGQRWPAGVPCYVATDADATGDTYAAEVRAALPPAVDVRRVRIEKGNG